MLTGRGTLYRWSIYTYYDSTRFSRYLYATRYSTKFAVFGYTTHSRQNSEDGFNSGAFSHIDLREYGKKFSILYGRGCTRRS